MTLYSQNGHLKKAVLEKIGTKHYQKLSNPNDTFLYFIKSLKKHTKAITIAEVGIGIGATTQSAIQLLDECDNYYLLDYSDKVDQLVMELGQGMPYKHILKSLGNSRFSFDSYVWSLYSLIQSEEPEEMFDLVFLDGAHDYTIDLAACALIIELLKPGGILIIDDINLSMSTVLEHNQSLFNELNSKYSNSQISACQMKMICDSFLDRQPQLKKWSRVIKQ